MKVVKLKGGKSRKHYFLPHQKGFRRRVSWQVYTLALVLREFIRKESMFPNSYESKLTMPRPQIYKIVGMDIK